VRQRGWQHPPLLVKRVPKGMMLSADVVGSASPALLLIWVLPIEREVDNRLHHHSHHPYNPKNILEYEHDDIISDLNNDSGVDLSSVPWCKDNGAFVDPCILHDQVDLAQ